MHHVETRIESRVIYATRQYMSKEGFDPTDVAKKNAAAGSLCESVKSIVRYYDEMSKGQPKLQVRDPS
jgi:hypothetical protein